MAIKLVDETTLNSNLTSIANAIRLKTGGTSSLAFPAGFVSEIEGISGGGIMADDVAEGKISGSISGNATFVRTHAFQSCSSLTTASFPYCTSIESYAFQYCTSLTEANFPSCITIGSYAFQYCNLLSTVNFPACTSIGNTGLGYCSLLTTISFPSCIYVGNYAFTACD